VRVSHDTSEQGITRALGYVETHAHRMRYVTLEARKLPIGSGQVESAVRRVVNLRCRPRVILRKPPSVA